MLKEVKYKSWMRPIIPIQKGQNGWQMMDKLKTLDLIVEFIYLHFTTSSFTVHKSSIKIMWSKGDFTVEQKNFVEQNHKEKKVHMLNKVLVRVSVRGRKKDS